MLRDRSRAYSPALPETDGIQEVIQEMADVGDQDPLRIPIEGSLDLHAFAPRDIPSVVDEYILEAHAAGLREVRLIHGRGRGTQRGIVQQLLEKHSLVVEFFDEAASHLGATIAILKPRPG